MSTNLISMTQFLSLLASGMREQTVAFIKSRPGAAFLGFACGYGAIGIIDALRERFMQKTPSHPPFSNPLFQRARFIATASKSILGCTGLAILAVSGWTGRFNTSLSAVFFLLGLGLKEHVKQKPNDKDPRPLIDICVDITANPPHLGHMDMIAVAIQRLAQEGYRINQVRVALGLDSYVKDKLIPFNQEIKKSWDQATTTAAKREMLKVLLPLQTRIRFLRAVIQQAKDQQYFPKDLKIDYFDRHTQQPTNMKTFFICGTDFVDKSVQVELEKLHSHIVVVTRDGKRPEWFTECRTDRFAYFIVDNTRPTNTYSSSKIQNGSYELLPEPIRKEFKQLHEAAQSQSETELTDTGGSKASTTYTPLEQQIIEHNFDFKIAPIGLGTAVATAQGFYIAPSGKKISLRTGPELEKISQIIPNELLKAPVESKYDKFEVLVIEGDCLDIAQQELTKGAQKVAVLMLASLTEPGGGMSDDNNPGQEEGLCRRSDIFGFMQEQLGKQLGKQHFYPLISMQGKELSEPGFCIIQYNCQPNRMIHVPQVTVFRSGKEKGYQMLETPFKVGMLVSPPLVRPAYIKADAKTQYQRPEDEEQLSKVIMTYLKVAYDAGYDTVILGALGCGAFGNPPELVAQFHKTIIDTYFKGAFKKIIFAIKDGARGTHNPEGNLKPFQQCFAPEKS